MKYKNIYLRKGKDESLQRFHPWVFSGAVRRMDDGITDGDVVRVLNDAGDFVAVGHFQRGSIMVRVLSFEDKPIDDMFWHKRLTAALSLRLATGLCDCVGTTAYRLVHGEGDRLPGLVVDCYGKTAVMQSHSIGMHICRHAIAEQLAVVMSGRIENIYYKSETTLSGVDGLGGDGDGFLYGSGATGIGPHNIATENGLRFYVDWHKGQKTGYFIDQRDNRSLLEHYSKDRHVLNMFCYTGGFTLYAMRGGARLVHSVDSSAKAIELTNLNVGLNFGNDPRHTAFCDDAFRYLGTMGDNYDLIVLDPPAFAKHRSALHNAIKGYIRLNAKALERITPGGLLFTFSCSQVVTKDNFRNAIFTAAAQARRNVRILHQLHQGADHPVNIYHPEGEYLKGLVLYVE